MLESLFNKVAGPKDYNFIKRRLRHRCFPTANTFFYRTPLVAASAIFNLAYFSFMWQGLMGGKFFLFHFANSIHCYSQILKKTNKLLRFDGIDLSHRKSNMTKEFT